MVWTGLLRKVEKDLTTPIIDFNDLTNYGLRLYDIDLGQYDEDPQSAGYPASGDYPIELLNRTLPEVTIRVGAEGSSIDNYMTAARALTRAIKDAGSYLFQPQGATRAMYFDGFTGRIPSAFHMQDDLHSFLANKFRDPYGVEVLIPRMPYLYGQNILASLQPFANATLLGDSDNNGRPDGWTWAGGNNPTGESIDGTLTAYRFTFATTANRDLNTVAGMTAVGSYAAGDYAVAQIEASTLAATVGNARILIVIEWMTSAGAVLATHTQTTQVLSDGFAKIQYTTPVTAPATTSRLRVTYRINNLAATSTTTLLRRAMVEKVTSSAATASTFRVGPETVSNDPADASANMGKAMFIYVPGNAPTRARITITPESGSNGGRFVQTRVGKRAYGNLPAFVNQVMFRQGEAADLTGCWDSAVVADGGSSGANALRIFTATYASGDTNEWAPRAKWSIAPAEKTAVEGKFRVFGRFKIIGHDDELNMKLQLKWAPGNVSEPSFANRVVDLDFDDTSATRFLSPQWFALDLGTISIEAGVLTTYGVTMHLWGKRSVSSGSPAIPLYLDHLFLMPVGGSVTSALDQSIMMASRGFLDDDGALPSSWNGNDLKSIAASSWGITAGGNNDGHTKVLDASEACGTPPNIGFKVVDGRHVIAVNTTLVHTRDDTETDPQKDWLGSLIVRQVTVPTIDLASTRLILTSRIGRKRKKFKVFYDRPGTDPFIQYQVVNHSNDTQYAGTGTVRVHDIKAWFIRHVTNPSALYVSGEYAFPTGRPIAQVISSAGLQVEPLRVRGNWIDLTPGLNVLMFDWGDTPIAEYMSVDVRGPLPASGNLSADTVSGTLRKATVAVDFYERWQ